MAQKSIYTESEINFIRENFPDKGVRYCMGMLNKTDKQIRSKARHLKLPLNELGKYKSPPKSVKPAKIWKVDQYQFMKPETPEVCYLLGLIWGDGSVSNVYTKYKSSHRVVVSLTINDFLPITPIFNKTGNWNFGQHQSDHGKMTMYAYTCNRPLVEYLRDFDYVIKSKSSPEKILTTIPDDMKRYFFQGLIDADGCFYKKFSLAAPYDQNWKFMENLFKNLGITRYKISRRHAKKLSKNGQLTGFSHFMIFNKPELKILHDYLYPNGYEFGFKRKYDTLTDMVKSLL
jgi:hypothetical protein